MKAKTSLTIALVILGLGIMKKSEAQVLGVQAFYSFNDSTTTDQSGNGQHGTNVNHTFGTDRFGNVWKAAKFEHDSSYMKMPDGIINQTEVSIALWFKSDSARGVIVGHADQPPYGGMDASQHVPLAFVESDSVLNMKMWDGGVSNYNDSLTNVLDKKWHHIVLAGNQFSQNIYVDNQLVGTGGGITYLSAMIYNQIGAGFSSGSWSTNTRWNQFYGHIDDVQIYHRMLDAAEVDTIFNAPNPCQLTASISEDTSTGTLSLTQTGFVSMQWYNGSTKIDEETNSTFTPDENGDYRIRVQDSLGCYAYSNTISITTFLGIKVNEVNDWVIYPNPAKDHLAVKGTNGKVHLNIYNQLGLLVATSDHTTVNVANLTAGLYIAVVLSEGKIITTTIEIR